MAHPTVQNHIRHVLAEALRSPEIVPLVHELYYAASDYHKRVTLPVRTKNGQNVTSILSAQLEERVRRALGILKSQGIKILPFNLDELCDAITDAFN